LTPASACIICKEHVSWICYKCNSLEYVIHSINYCRSNYRDPWWYSAIWYSPWWECFRTRDKTKIWKRHWTEI